MNGMTEVTLVPPPADGIQRVVRSIYVSIPDPDQIYVEISYAYGVQRATIWRGILQPRDTLMFGDGDALILEGSGDSIVGILGANPANQPNFTSNWGDRIA